jgi:hypothetical protein
VHAALSERYDWKSEGQAEKRAYAHDGASNDAEGALHRSGSDRILVREVRTAEKSSERMTAAGMLLDRAYGKPITAPDIAVIRQDVKKHLADIVMGGPQAMKRLADLKRRLAQLVEFDAHRVIEAIAASVDDGAVP